MATKSQDNVLIIEAGSRSKPSELGDYVLWHGDVAETVAALASAPIFDLVITSPPYNLGKDYEIKMELEEYVKWQAEIIEGLIPLIKDTGSICWQVGNYVSNGEIWPLDIELAPVFKKLGMKLRNRIVWKFGHGLHAKKRFSGRYEVVLWYTKSDSYTFNLDPVRVPAKYPGKKAYKGPRKGQYSGNPRGKNPEDVWEIPNVKSNHVEKTIHPAQFPVGLVERLILSLTNEDELIFDPFAGVASAGVAAAIHKRKFWGCDIIHGYLEIGRARIEAALMNQARYRPHNKPLYDHKKSKLSQTPKDYQ